MSQDASRNLPVLPTVKSFRHLCKNVAIVYVQEGCNVRSHGNTFFSVIYFLLEQIRKTQVNQGASVACTKKLITVKARRDTYGATGHAHINTASFLSHCTTIVTIFSFL